ncbi:hypothetical protein F4805DRAFT_414395 [Annulohypoxylon moriforme]|nr:hypothetical protein F4805DRAFT_414395 [Annulohypoxylon moriforme]
MRVTYFLSTFLATLAIASPISSNVNVAEGADLVTRDTTVLTQEYQELQKVHPNPEDNQWYWVYQKDRLGAKIQDGDAETLTELEQLQKSLGFEHVGVIVGQIKVTEKTTKAAGKTTTKHFDAFYYHMTKNKQNVAVAHAPVWKANMVDFTKSFLQDGGKTNKRGSEKAKTNSKTFFDDPKHKTYSVADNNCNTFAQYVITAFR